MAVALFTLATVIVASKQWQAARDGIKAQYDALEVTQRPWLLPTDLRYAGCQDADKPNVQATWKNSGNSPALDIVSRHSLVWGERAKLPPRPDYDALAALVQSKSATVQSISAMGPGEIDVSGVKPGFDTTTGCPQLEDGTATILFGGMARYTDQFRQQTHWTKFTAVWTPGALPGGGFNVITMKTGSHRRTDAERQEALEEEARLPSPPAESAPPAGSSAPARSTAP